MVGSLSGGLCVFSTADFRRIRYFPPGNELYGINHMHKDAQNRIWVRAITLSALARAETKAIAVLD